MPTDHLSTLSLTNNIYLNYNLLVDEIYQRIMDKLHQNNYQGLKLSHALILLQLSAQGARISDIAKSQAVSKQAIGQIANELESLGFIEKTADANDKRAKCLQMSPRGIELVIKAAGFLQQVEQQLADEIGAEQLSIIKQHSKTLFKALHLSYPNARSYAQNIKQTPLISHASAITTWLDLQFIIAAKQYNHPVLKKSAWQILNHIHQQATSINDLANHSGISKQAVSQLASDLEKKGYIQRIDHPSDKRSKPLALSKKGQKLIKQTLLSISLVESKICAILGKNDLEQLRSVLNHFTCITQKHGASDTLAQIQQALNVILNNSIEAHLWLIDNKLSPYALDALSHISLQKKE